MSKYVVFENKGVIDMRAITTFGVSAKETDNPFGQFGTGNKYSVAILLRENQFITIIAGTERFNFEKKNIDFRGKQFEMLTMNGNELPYTTHLGMNWKLWQAFREIYCNCMDESGQVYMSDTIPEFEEGKTFFVVSGSEFEELYRNKSQFILTLPESLKVSKDNVFADIFNTPSRALFYKGIKVYDFDKESKYTYNITDKLSLTEDRTVENIYIAMSLICKAIASLKDGFTIKKIITAEKESVEGDLNYQHLRYSDALVSDEFKSTLAQEFKDNNFMLNPSAKDYHRKLMNLKASMHYEPEEMTKVETQQLKRATEICNLLYSDFSDFKILIVKSLGNETMALADMNDKVIVISKPTFKMGTKYLVSTMLEEYIHLKTGFGDQTRQLQTHLFDTITTMIEDHIIGAPI